MTDTTKAQRDAQLARLRALMSRTVANGCTEAEAQSAAAAVDRLLGTYEIDLDEVTLREQEIIQVLVKTGDHDVRYATVKTAAFCDCKVWHANGGSVFLGFPVDTEVAEYLTLMFMRAIDREFQDFTMFNQDYNEQNAPGRREMATSFRIGMASRLGDRLTELKGKRDFTKRSGGTDLVAIKWPLVQAAFAATGISLGHSRGKSIRHQGAYAAGQSAANGVQINQGIASRGPTGGRLR